MADQDYPTLHSQLLDQTARMKNTVTIAEKIVYGPDQMVPVPGGSLPTLAKRINDRIKEITGVGPVSFNSLSDVPSSFPSSWNTMQNKPAIMTNPMSLPGDMIWNDFNGMPAAISIMSAQPGYVLTVTNTGIKWSAPTGGGGGGGGTWDSITDKPTSFPSSWDEVDGKPEGLMVNPMTTAGSMIYAGPDGTPYEAYMAGQPAGTILIFDGTYWNPGQIPKTSLTVTEYSFYEVEMRFDRTKEYLRLTSDQATSVLILPDTTFETEPWTDAEFNIEAAGDAVVTIVAQPGVTVNRRPNTKAEIIGKYGVVKLRHTGPNTWTLSGDLAPV